MPPLPTLWDPAGAVDKLPQPFRMIDKILADIVEQVVDMIGTRESQRRAEDASRVDLTFAPHAVMEVAPETCCFLPIGIAGIAAVAMPDGEVQVRSARDPSICFSDRTHTSPVTAMEAGMAVCTSGRLLAAASRTALTLHEVDIKTCEISLLATVPLPADPDDTSPPVRLHWSDNLGHLAVCRRSGALALFTLSLPPPNVSLESVGAFVALSLKAFGETRVEELLRVPAATVRAFCLGSAAVGPSNLVWQLQQRPDKSPHSDRYHKAASSKSVAPPGEASSLLTASASAAAAAYAGPERPPEVPQIAPMARDWLLPHDVTAAATTSDHKTMAWGLADGSVVIWDDRSCCSTKVLPRLKGGITALSWVNGVAHKLRPRVFWYNVLEEKPVAELMGPRAEQGFGLACCEAPSEPAMSEAQRALIKAALDAMGANSTTPVLVPVKLHVPAGQVVSYPACVFRDTYLLAGGDVVDKVVRSNFADDDAVPQRVTQLYMYKAGQGKRVKMDVEDPDAPKLSSAMRKPDPFDTTGSRPGSRAANRHITFGGGDADGLFDDVLEGGRAKPKKETKVFPKETKKGLKTGPGDVKMIDKNASGRPRLAPLDLEKAKEAPLPFSERSQSPPWHHTNPLARIHPDWEEAPVLVRIMDRIGSKGGGRKRRDKRLEALTTELMTKYSKEAGAKPNLLVPT
eukprot:XP_001690036.1 predicted protein [Chlamydomonas reinhardtii]